MFDEYRDNKDEALKILDRANSVFGADPILSRARAKIYWRHDQHSMAVEQLVGIADKIGLGNPIERAFALREAAISAAKCEKWDQSKEWFLEASQAAISSGGRHMLAMATGLKADAAVSAVKGGYIQSGLALLFESLKKTDDITPDESTHTAYCHRVIRHTVLWIQSFIEGVDKKLGGEYLSMAPGACSNPEPNEEACNLPLGHIDIAWYMLANTEIKAGVDVGIYPHFQQRIGERCIPFMEFEIHKSRLEKSIELQSATDFCAYLMEYLSSAKFFFQNASKSSKTLDPISPTRSNIRSLPEESLSDPIIITLANDAIITFLMISSVQSASPTNELRIYLRETFGEEHPGKAVFSYFSGAQGNSIAELDKTVLDFIQLLNKQSINPREFCILSLRFLEKAKQSYFNDFLVASIARWQRLEWRSITTNKRSQLVRPFKTVPAVEKALSNPKNCTKFLAEVLLAAAEATDVQLGREYFEHLEELASE